MTVLPGGGAKPRARLAGAVAFVALLAAILAYAGAVLTPPRSERDPGAAWGAYLAQPRNSIDAVFFGSSHVFDGVDPAVLWRRRGIAGFSHAGPAQPLRMTKYYVFEALRTQKPEVVAVEVSGVSHSSAVHNSKMHQINVAYMPLSTNKVKAAVLVTPSGERVQSLVALWAYHTRWMMVSWRDFDVVRKGRDSAYLRGYQPLIKPKKVPETPEVMTEEDRREVDKAMEVNIQAIYEIAEACRDNGAQLLLFLTPTGPPASHSYQLEWTFERVRKRYSETRMLDLSAAGAVPGLSYEKDFFDGGHLRYTGAEKNTEVLADYLARTYDLPDRRSDPAYASYTADAEKHDAYIQRRMGNRAK